VEGLHGALRVESAPGQGTRVYVFLPATLSPRAAEAPAGEARRAAALPAGGLVLVIEDEAMIRQAVRDILETHGLRTHATATGEEGLQALRELRGEVMAVLLDLTMPGMSGARVYQEIRAMDADIPVIVSSGYTEEYVADQFGGAAPPLFLPKPYRPRELIEKLRQAVAGTPDAGPHDSSWRRAAAS
ncbi:MAG: response regulator, partial [Armatimonadota bacterium]|nr:response regulator [Armatimonadota bacterium]